MRVKVSWSFILSNSIVQEGKKKFDKETMKFCSSLERHLNLSTKKSENHLQEVRDKSGI